MSQPVSEDSSAPSSASSAEGFAPARTISPAFLFTYYTTANKNTFE
jgi:hypothetical protein